MITDRMTRDLKEQVPAEEPKKELLIFAIYIEMGTQSEQKTRTRLSELRDMYSASFKEIEKQTNYLIKSFIFPIREGTTRMECIFSGNNTKTGKANIEELFGTLEEPAKGFTVNDPDKKAMESFSEYCNTVPRPVGRTLYE